MTMRLLAVLTMVAGTLSLHSAEAVSADSAKVVTVEVGSFYFEDGSTGSQSLVSANVGDQLRFVFYLHRQLAGHRHPGGRDRHLTRHAETLRSFERGSDRPRAKGGAFL